MMTMTRRAAILVGLSAIGAASYWIYGKMTAVKPNFANLAYGDDARNVLDIYLPAGAGPFGFVLEIHGGAFKMGDKTAMPLQSEVLAAGIAIVRMNYRLSGTDIWPAQGEDCLAAVEFLRANAAQHGLDPARMAIWGQSAGGFLAVSTAISLAQSDAPAQAVVDFYGPMDFSTMDLDMADLGRTAVMGNTMAADSPESQLLGFNVADDPARARSLGPIGRIEGAALRLPPAFIRHGDADDLIAPTQSERLAKAWAAVDPAAQVDFALVPGAGHGTSEFNAAGVVEPMIAFLQSALQP